MERLTKRDRGGNAVVDCDVCEMGESRLANCSVLKCRNRLKDRLAAYRDRGGSLRQLADARGWDLTTDDLRRMLDADKLPFAKWERLTAVLDGMEGEA